MRESFRSLRIDRERAVKVATMVGLAILGISTLPGLLRTPDPPPVPAGVGFSPAEMARYANQPAPPATHHVKHRRAPEGKRKREPIRKGRATSRRQRRKTRNGDHAKRSKTRDVSGPPAAPDSPDTPSASPPSSPSPSATPSVSPAPTSPPVSAALPVSPAPSDSPSSTPPQAPPPSPPADGSQEFAPR
jgi:hypothetical protein